MIFKSCMSLQIHILNETPGGNQQESFERLTRSEKHPVGIRAAKELQSKEEITRKQIRFKEAAVRLQKPCHEALDSQNDIMLFRMLQHNVARPQL